MRKFLQFACDFETTVYDGQKATEVWAAACCPLDKEDVKIFGSIGEQLEYFYSLKSNVIAYYHNLKFDGSFWLSYLMKDLRYKHAYNEIDKSFHLNKDMVNNSFKYTISNLGQWYTITIKHNNKIIEIRDSLKLLPFSLRKIGQSFKTKHQKLDMEYHGFRYAGCPISKEEKDYIANDVLVLKEGLNYFFAGVDVTDKKLTIGACCLSEFKRNFLQWDTFFPKLEEIAIPEEYNAITADEYIRKSYRGGWCYVVPSKANKILKNGFTADVNSLYPSVMHSESGNYYPVGKPTFFKGKPNLSDEYYYFVRVKVQFDLKPGYLPFIQVKGNLNYKPTEMLVTSDIYDKKSNKYYSYYNDDNGVHPAELEITFTKPDFELFKEHYNIRKIEYLDGCYFRTEIGLFDQYINKYRKIKVSSKGAKRELAKLFLNNLYGKLASSTKSNFKVAYLKDNVIAFKEVKANNKKAGFIAIGSAITSYARCFTIRAAQANYNGSLPGFAYADTDSIHCDYTIDNVKGIRIHDSDFCCWKIESEWSEGWFVRQKTYIEKIYKQDGEDVEPYYNIKCAGLPVKSKQLLKMSFDSDYYRNMTKDEQLEVIENAKITVDEFKWVLENNLAIDDFTVGITIPGKLLPKRIIGGILLKETSYKIR